MKSIPTYFNLFLVATSCLITVLSFGKVNGQNIVIEPYLQDVGQEEISIMWEADNIGQGKILWGIDAFSLINESIGVSIIGSGASRIHTATLLNLNAGIKYYYKVEMANGVQSKLYTFKTLELPGNEQSTQFVAMSDMQRDGSKPDKFREIVEEGIVPIVYSEIGDSLYDLEAILIPGDLVVTGGNYSQWRDHFFSKADSITPNVPIYPVPGNHEYSGGGLPNFKKYFSLPQNGLGVLQDECWYKDISNVRIIGLNSNSGSSDQNIQLDWLGTTLDSACSNEHIDFVFAELHHPFKSELWTPGENGFTGKVIDSLESFTEQCGKASIHFFGHTHAYSRGQSRDHKHLWMNVATAGGAIDNWGEFPNADYPEFVKSQDEYGFVLIDVLAGDDPMFTIKRYSRGDQDMIIDNVLRDSLTILNNDIAPQTPQNIFPLGDTLLPYCVVLKASTFYGIDDIHQGSHWQVASGQDFDTSIIAEKWAQNENFYNEVNLQENDDLTDELFTNFNQSDTIFWRVRYRNQNLEWSDWSSPSTFFLDGDIDTLTSNLVLNGGAENGINNWVGDIEALEQGACGSVLPYEGDFNFGVGGICQNESSSGIATQGISLGDYQTQIDNDKISVGFGAYMRNWSGSDIPEMYVELYENDNLITTSSIISNVTPIWIQRTGIINIPEAVDSCVVVLKGTRLAGTDNDSYFDLIDVFLVDVGECPSCYGTSFIDNDADGYCDDVDCDETNKDIYPGAIELCNGIDDDCDGIADFGDTVNWTGAGGSNLWSETQNWDQQLVPLPCQHVIIDNSSTVVVDGEFECYSLDVATNNQLQIGIGNTLIINSKDGNIIPSATISGTMTINGRCEMKNSQGKGFEVFGTLINNNKLNLSDIDLETIFLRNGGRFDSLGKTILK
jgi:hypothetical protein